MPARACTLNQPSGYPEKIMPKYSRIAALLITSAVFASLPAKAQTRGPSTPEERARAVEVAKALRVDPVSRQVQGDREWLISWLIEIPDISVKLCSNFLGDITKGKKEYSGALLASMMASDVSFLIEHPAKVPELDAVYLAGVEGALDSYQAIQKRDSHYHLFHLDELLQKREQGKLAEYVHDTAKTAHKRFSRWPIQKLPFSVALKL
jgi:hypothetical protein